MLFRSNEGRGVEPVMTKNGPVAVSFSDLSKPFSAWDKKPYKPAEPYYDPFTGAQIQ